MRYVNKLKDNIDNMFIYTILIIYLDINKNISLFCLEQTASKRQIHKH